jgi:BON domain
MKRTSLWVCSLALATILGVAPGCSSKPDDAKISSEIQSKFSQDSGLSTKQLTVQASDGVVTLAGTVDNDAQRETASRQASTVAGVRTVVNNLKIADASTTTPAREDPRHTSPPPPVSATAAVKTKPAPGKKSKSPSSDDSTAQNPPADANADQPTASTSSDSPAAAPNNAPAAPADATSAQTPPSPRKLIIDQGTQLAVRLIDPIDSEKNQTGDTFHATLNASLSSDGQEAIPAGTELTGHLVDVKSAGKFAGQSVLILQLDSITSGGQTYNLHTDQYKKEGSSRGKNTAAKVGGGAVIGSIIGAIAGGGKGAAIGGAAGAGAGGGVQAASKPQPIKLPSETVLNFTLQEPITVVPPTPPDPGRQKLTDSQ